MARVKKSKIRTVFNSGAVNERQENCTDLKEKESIGVFKELIRPNQRSNMVYM